MPRPPGDPDTSATRQDLRDGKRIKTFVVGELHRSDEAVRVHVLDLSSGGAMVHARSAPAVGEDVRLTIDSQGDRGRIVWVAKERFGIRFALPMSRARIDDIIDG